MALRSHVILSELHGASIKLLNLEEAKTARGGIHRLHEWRFNAQRSAAKCRCNLTSAESGLYLGAATAPVVLRRQAPRRLRHVAQSGSSQVKEIEVDEELCELVSGMELELGSGKDTFGAYLVVPKKNDKGSGVLLLTDIRGQADEDARGYASRLACFGFSVLVPDLFRGQPWDDSRSAAEYESWRAKHTPNHLSADIAVATDYLSQFLKEKALAPGNGLMAVMGFCLGGGRLFEVLAADKDKGAFAAGISFYGTRYDPELASSIKAPTLVIVGDSDDKSPLSVVREVESRFKKSRLDHKVVVYPGRGHAFAHRPADMAEDQDAEDAFGLTKEWLNTHLLGA